MQINLDAICSEPLFNSTVSWNTNNPVFTNCFCKATIVIPAIALICVLFPYIIFLRIYPKITVRWTWLLSSKVIIGALLSVTVLLDLLKAASDEASGKSPDLIDYISPGILLLALLLCLVLNIVEQSRRVTASAVLFFFYCSSLLLAVPLGYNWVVNSVESNSVTDIYSLCTFAAYLVLLIVQLVLTCVYDRGLGIDADQQQEQNVFREFYSSILSRLTYSWLDKSVLAAYKDEITDETAENLDPSLKVRQVHGDFIKYFDKARRRYQLRRRLTPATSAPNPLYVGNVQSDDNRLVASADGEAAGEEEKKEEKVGGRSLVAAVVRAFGAELAMSWLVLLMHGLILFLNPFMLNLFIEFVANPEEEAWHGYLYTFVFFVIGILGIITFHSAIQVSLSTGIKIRSSLIAAVYRKSLTLTQESRARSTIGEIVNLMTVDANKIADAVPFLWAIIVSPPQIALALAMLWGQLGTAVLAGIAVFVIIVPINGYIMAKSQKLEEKEMATKDERLKLLNEVVNAMRIIKLYAWELSFMKKINDVRKKEMGYLGKNVYLFAVIIVVWTLVPFVVMIITFITYIYTGEDHVLTANKAFVSLTLFNIIRFPITMLPWSITESVNAYVSFKRIQKFLFEDDIDESSVLRLPSGNRDEYAVEVDDSTFGWSRDESREPLLKDVNFRVKRGRLVAIVGRVGCGKSTLLQSLLGETIKLSGSIVTRGSVAYVPQEAWIQNLSVRENILFGQQLVQEKYDQVIGACQLAKDLELLAAGDATEIGERGINLSGGQKQRVSLARAVYQDCDLYLLDDPLAAVDSHVGKKLFHDVIGHGGLLDGKTRLLVTHGIHWLPHVDEILVLSDGVISECGTYDDLIEKDGAFAQFLKEFFLQDRERGRSRDPSQSLIDEPQDAEPEEDEEVTAERQRILSRLLSHTGSIGSQASPDARRPSRQISRISQASRVSEESKTVESKTDELKTDESKKSEVGRLTEEESLESGRVSYKAYIFYFVARGVFLSIIVAVLYTVFACLNVLASLWLSNWTSDPRISDTTGNRTDEVRDVNDWYLGVYGGIGLAMLVVVSLFSVLQGYSSLRASNRIHSATLNQLFRAPMSFFDTTPTGRVANRFSKDLEVVDRELNMVIGDVIECLAQTLSTLFVIAYTTPLFLLAVVPMAVVYGCVQTLYLPISRQSRRLDSRSRSPILNNFSESIAGAAVIRAFRQQSRFVNISDSRVDDNSRFYFLKLSSNRWLGFRLELLSNLAVVAAAIFAVLGRHSLTPGLVGLSMSYALSVADFLNYLVRQLTELETDSVAVERLGEYAQLEPEAEWTTSSTPPAGWPTSGCVQFCNFAARYRPDCDLVLNGVNVTLQPGQRVGIVGRTGAGKSSLTFALFRLIESAFGHIEIDGVRIDRLGLHALRSALTILPQDPTVFSGSLRSNLDPFGQHSDQRLWSALETAHLAEWARTLPQGLMHECGEGGVNLSVGQRQLVCLARAVMRSSRLLVLDEATAAVDLETDSLIMATVRREFKDATVLIIAHRLATIMDADRVLVMETGRVKEFDSPQALLKDENSFFHFLAKEANLLPASGRPDAGATGESCA